MHRLHLPLTAFALVLALTVPAVAFAQEVPEETPFAGASDPAPREPEVPDLEELLGTLFPEPASSEPEGLPAEAGEGLITEPLPVPSAPRTPEDHVARAAETFEATGAAPVVGLPTGQVHPFGESVPEIVCLPYRACDLELQAGETVDGLALGDPQRWSSEFLFEGPPEAAVPHIVLKPAGHGLRTNAVVVTSRRTYHLELSSPEEGEPEPTAYHHHVSWWYPADWVRRSRETRARAAAREALPAPSPVERPLDLSELSFRYRIEEPRRARRRLPWRPVTVFDDGTRTFVKLPAASRRGDLPALMGELPDGSLFPLEARLAGEWWIVPEVARRLQLVLGAGKSKRSLTLVNEAAGEGASR